MTATAARSGASIDQTYWQAARLRDGKIVAFGFFRSEAEAEALEAFGLGQGPPRPSDS